MNTSWRALRNYGTALVLGASLALSPMASASNQFAAPPTPSPAATASSAAETVSPSTEGIDTKKVYRWKKKCTTVKHKSGPKAGKPVILPNGKPKKQCIQYRVEVLEPKPKPWTPESIVKPLSVDPPWEPAPTPPSPTVLSEPLNVASFPGNQEVTLTWDPPASDGGSSISDYIVQFRVSPDSTWQTFDDGISTALTAKVTGLANGTSYDFHVAAVNATETSTYSRISVSTPRTVPTAPRNLTAVPGNEEALLSWEAPTSDGGAAISGYTVSRATAADGPWTVVGTGVTVRNLVVSGLNNSSTYWFRVVAVNVAGDSPAATTTEGITPRPTPTAPLNLTATAGNQQAALTWNAPTNSGASAITGYTVSYGTSASGPWTQAATALTTRSYTVTGLTNGTGYWFRVSAVNNDGEGVPAFTASATTPRTIPGAPLSVVASPGNAQVQLAWSVPTSNGGTAISDYPVRYRLSGSATWTTVTRAPSSATSATITGLTNGSTYEFQVAATNEAGTGSYSSTATATPRTVPSAPQQVVGIPDDRAITATWQAPTDDGGATVTGYTVTYGPSATGPWTQAASDVAGLTYTVTGLTNGQPYWLRIQAKNPAGEGAAAITSTSLTPRTVPSAPLSPTGNPGNNEVALSWGAPTSDGGAAITGYTVSYATSINGPWTQAATGIPQRTYTVVGLTNGQPYWFRVAAANAAGSGAPAVTAVSSTPRTVPFAPSNLSTESGPGEVSLTWTAPSFNGGAAITGYTIYYATSAEGPWTEAATGVTATEDTIQGLTNGQPYWFQVTASNAAGEGAPVVSASSITPRTVPGSPTNIGGVPDNEEVSVTWTAPTFDGGAPISSYTVSYSTSAEGPWTQASTGIATSPYLVTGLDNGTPYWFQITATNEAGEGAAAVSANSITPRTVPDAPTALSAQPSDQQVALSWEAPAFDGGNTIVNYIVEYRLSPDGEWQIAMRDISATTTATVMGLTNSTSYDFRVAAVNDAGASLYSDAVSAIPALPPAEPENLAAQFGNEEVTLTWEAPLSDGGSALTGYVVQYRLSPEGAWQTFLPASPLDTSATVTGLDNGVAYDFQVAATNPVATGGFTAPVTETPATTPSAPLNLLTYPDDAQVGLIWSMPESDGGAQITGYTVSYATSTEGPWTEFSSGDTDTGKLVTGLDNGVAYWFKVTATNKAGAGAAVETAASVTPRTIPDAPQNLTGAAGNQQVELTWEAPVFDGGAPLTGYTVYGALSAEGPWVVAATEVQDLSYTVTGLDNGTPYWFTVTASNVAGESPDVETATSITPRTVPSTPVNLSGTPDNQQVALTWETPTSDGGASISGYNVYFATSTEGPYSLAASEVTDLTYTVTGLQNGQEYWFGVTAVNDAGEGSPEVTLNSITPRTVPDAPENLTASPNDTEITLTWDTPLSDGGAAISDYLVEYRVSPAGEWTTVDDGESTSRSVLITGLTNGQEYDFRVAAINVAGTGAWSNVVTQAPCTIPDAPTNLNATLTSGQTSAALTWTAPVNNGGVAVTYTVEYATAATGPWTEFASGVSTTSSTVTGLTGITSGTKYWFNVSAVNPAGPSTPVAAGVTGYDYSGSLQSFSVPSGITSLSVVAAGGAGGGGSNTVPGGGSGGSRVTAALAVSGGQTLYIATGGGGIGAFTCAGSGSDQYGARAGGWPGGGSSGNPTWYYYPGCISVGGSGGGYSGIFSSNSLTQGNALLIAAGGGGRGVGGGANGADGTTTGGGTRGTPNGSGSSDNTNGSALLGGNGESNAYAPATYPGGGGGGGYFGGGGGAAGGAGGNGASWTGGTASSVSITAGVQAGNGFVTLKWTP